MDALRLVCGTYHVSLYAASFSRLSVERRLELQLVSSPDYSQLGGYDAIVQMSLLAFAGLLAGLLREGGKMAVAFGMLLGSSILSIYLGNQADVMSSTWESVAAAVLLLSYPSF